MGGASVHYFSSKTSSQLIPYYGPMWKRYKFGVSYSTISLAFVCFHGRISTDLYLFEWFLFLLYWPAPPSLMLMFFWINLLRIHIHQFLLLLRFHLDPLHNVTPDLMIGVDELLINLHHFVVGPAWWCLCCRSKPVSNRLQTFMVMIRDVWYYRIFRTIRCTGL